MHKQYLSAFTKPSVLAITLIVAFAIPFLSLPEITKADINNTRLDAFGTDELAGSSASNMSGQGVDVYSNGSSSAPHTPEQDNSVNGVTTGAEWQCVELINRLYATKGWITTRWAGDGSTLINNLPTGTTEQNYNAVTFVNPGDVITFDEPLGGPGHAVYVSSVSGNTVNVVSQNTQGVLWSLTWSGTTLSQTYLGSAYNVQAIVHNPGTPPATPPAKSLASNGGFNNGLSPWAVGGPAHYAVYTSSNAYEGSGYGATNSQGSGGSIYQDVPLTINSGDTYCANVRAVTDGSSGGGGGSLVLWLMGGTSNENSYVTFANLPGNFQWTTGQTCVTATTSHTTLRIQFYPTVNGPTIDLDALDTHLSLANNGGFNSGLSPWAVAGPAHYATYTSGSAYEGTGYGSSNSQGSGGSIYQDVALTINPGDTYCGNLDATTDSTTSGGSGSFVLWLLGGSSSENSGVALSNLPAFGQWATGQTCVTATTTHTSLRIQFYPTVNGPTVDLDSIDVHRSLASYGGFNNGLSTWAVAGPAHYATYTSGSAYEGTGYGASNSQGSGGSIYQDVPLAIAAGDTFCANARAVTDGTTSGGGGGLVLWMLGGTSNENSSFAFTNLPSNFQWVTGQTCVTATTAHTSLRIQFYPTVNGPTVDLDAIDVT